MNRADKVRQVLVYDAMASAAKDRAAVLRRELAGEAQAEYEQQGMAPTWRMPGLATATLPVSQAAVIVADSEAFTKWVAGRHPDQVETVTHVRPAFVANVDRVVEVHDGVVVDPDTGEVVPGLAFRPAGVARALSIRAADREGNRGVAEAMLSQLWPTPAQPADSPEAGEV